MNFIKNGRINRKIQVLSSGKIEIIGLEPNTEYEVIGVLYYYDENGIDTQEQFYKGIIHTLNLDTLGTINFNFENGDIYSNKVEIKNLKILNSLSDEVIQGISSIRVQIDGIEYNLYTDQVNSLKNGEPITYQTAETVDSNSNIDYQIKAYDKYNNELKVKNNTGKTRTSKKMPSVNINVTKQDITEVNINIQLRNEDNVKLQNYIYIITNQKNEIVKQGNLEQSTKRLTFTDLNPNDYFKIEIYADIDINDGKGLQENQILGSATFITQPISSLGAINIEIENKETSPNSIFIGISIDTTKTDLRLISMLSDVTVILTSETGENHTLQLSEAEINNMQIADTVNLRFERLSSNTKYAIRVEAIVEQGTTKEQVETIQNLQEIFTPKLPAEVQLRNQFIVGDMIDIDFRIEDIDKAILTDKVRVELRDNQNKLISLEEIDTNQDFVRKIYKELIENTTYKLIFYAPEYNEGQTDSTYKSDYVLKEIELNTKEGISGTIDLENIQRAIIGKNLLDANSKVNWYYPCFGAWETSYGIQYDEETNIITLGNVNQNYWNRYLYDFSDYIGEIVTISFNARLISEESIESLQLYCDENIWYSELKKLTSEWQEYSYTLEVAGNGYLGFNTAGNGQFEVTNLQVELGTQKTSYEPFNYNLQANIIINLEDKRNEIITNDYYIRIYKNGEQIDEKRYEELGEENIIDGIKKSYEVDEESDYRIELLVKIQDRYYILDYQEFKTGDSTEIKGINSVEEFLRIQPYGKYIILNDLDLTPYSGDKIRFGGGYINYITFEGTIDFNGKKIIRDRNNSEYGIFSRTGTNSLLENVIIDIRITNEIETNFSDSAFVTDNSGTIRNIQVNFTEGNVKPNTDIYLLCKNNYGIIENFTLDFEDNLYIHSGFGLIQNNYGTIKNGYAYGKNIKAVYKLPDDWDYKIGVVVTDNRENGLVKNIFSLINVDLGSEHKESLGTANIVYNNNDNATVQNLYSVGIGNNITNFEKGPNIFDVISEKISNSYYFTNEIFNNQYNTKGNKLSLYDTQFQNQLINAEGAFDVDNLVSKGYYPQIIMPEIMPKQEYIELPEVENADLPDILSTKVIEQGSTSVKVEFSVNNPAAEQISSIEIANITTNILSQTYNEGKSVVVAELVEPTVFVSEYSVLSIQTLGAFGTGYTRTYAEGERTIYVDLYREIWNTDDWRNIANSPNENYILMANLDFALEGNTVAISEIHGKLNGNNHTISNIILTENTPLIGSLYGDIINLDINNFRQESTTAGGIIENAYVGSLINNVHIQGLDIIKTDSGDAGGIVSHGKSNIIRNCSISNLNIDVQTNEIEESLIIGGILGQGENSSISNSYIQNLNINNKNAITTVTGGIVGTDTKYTDINNCYVIGNINTEGSNAGGIIGLFSDGGVKNTYSKVNIYSNNQFVGGIIGTSNLITEDDLRHNVVNNLSIGNIYTTLGINYLNRIIGNTNATASNNYAYINQQLNGFKSEEKLGATLLSSDEALKLDLGEYYSYEGSIDGILPKLYNFELTELLKNQQNNFLQNEIELSIENVYATKLNTTEAEITVILNNVSEVEINEIEIEDMTCGITKNVTKNGTTSITVKATPQKYYDSYKITKIKYKIGDSENEIETNVEVDVQFYKELYTFEDWQSIEEGTYQNYRLMNDIDFAGRTNAKSNVTMNRLEAENNIYTLKNINLTFYESNTGLIQNIKTSMKNIKFENVILQNMSTSGENFGIITVNNADIDNLKFNNITIQAENLSNVAIISNLSSGNITNVEISNIKVSGGNYTASLVGQGNLTSNNIISKVNVNDATVAGNDYTGGIIGYINTTYNMLYDTVISDSSITGNNTVGGISGYSGGNNLQSINNTIIGGSNVGGIAGSLNRGIPDDDLHHLTVDGCDIQISGVQGGGIAGFINNGTGVGYFSVLNTNIEGTTVNSNQIGGLFGLQNTWTVRYFQVQNCNIISKGSYIGGVVGSDTTWSTNIAYGQVTDTTIEGATYVGGIAGLLKWCQVHDVSVNANITATYFSAGGLVGYLQNGNMSATIYTTQFLYTMILDSVVKAPAKAGGYIGEIEKEIYRDETFYLYNYIHAEVTSDDPTTSSLIIGSIPSESIYIKDTYVYRYSILNGEYIFNTTDSIEPSQYITGEELKNESTYAKFMDNNYFNVNNIYNNVYPSLYDALVLYPELRTEITLPTDPTSTNSIQSNALSEIVTQSLQKLPSVTYYSISAYEFNIDFSEIPEDTYYIYSVNGKEIEEVKIEARTYTFEYNYQDTITLKIKNSSNENIITITPDDLISRISLVDDSISYLSNNSLYVNEKKLGEYSNVFKGNALRKDGYVLDIITNSIIMPEKVETRLEKEAKPQNSYSYNGNNIQVYGTYSTINDNIKTQIYNVKNGKLSAISNNLSMKIGNIITDNFNGKEYQTILNLNGELEDLKEKLSYPDGFLNSNIIQLVQNESEIKTQAMVYYESGKIIVFDYVTGEIIYENNMENAISLFNYIADSFSNIWSDYEEKQISYQDNIELIEKLKEIPVEKAIEQVNINNITNIDSNISIDTDINNNQIPNNNSTDALDFNNNYITVYNPDINGYEVYSENEILTGDEEPVSENKKIKLNDLQNFYNYQVVQKSNEINGTIIISLIIIIIILALIILRRYMSVKRKKNAKIKKNKKIL